MKKFYYIYSWYDPRDGKPIYVGKGTQHIGLATARFARANRVHLDRKNLFDNPMLANICNKIRREGLKVQVKIHKKKYLSLEDVHAEEIRLITKIGRRDLKTGSLCNLTDGGDGTTKLLFTKVMLKRAKERMEEFIKDEKFQKKRLAGMKKLHADPAYRARLKKMLEKRNSSPEFIAKVFTPARRKSQSDLIKSQRTDPAFNRKHSAAMRKFHRDHPEFQAKANSPENRARQSERARLQWKDPKFRAKMLAQNNNSEFQAKCHSAENRKKASKRIKIQLKDEKFQNLALDGRLRTFALRRHMEYLKDVWGLDVNVRKVKA